MTKFNEKSFTVGMGGGKGYRDNWSRVFGYRDAMEQLASFMGTVAQALQHQKDVQTRK